MTDTSDDFSSDLSDDLATLADTPAADTGADGRHALTVIGAAITATMSIPTTACQILKSTTPTKKKTNVTNKAIPTPMAIIFIGRSRCVRSTATDWLHII